jgi:hypothetical protein
MSSPATHTHTPPASPPAPPPYEIKIVSHSNLFYWWPVWAVGFIIALLTTAGSHRLAVVPKDTRAYRGAQVEVKEDGGKSVTYRDRDVLVTPKAGDLPPFNKPDQPADDPHFRIATEKSYGVLFMIVLLLVIVITNVPMRGLWSVVAIVTIVALAIIFALAEYNGRSWWDHILEWLGRLHIYMNAAGYWVFSLALFVVWLVTFVFFDPQIYMVFTPKQLRVRQEIGGGEAAYDTTGMVIQKQRNDLFRHWVLGLGSGDLIVNTSGSTAHHFDMPNVLFVGYKLRQIEDMLREVQVTS